VPASGPVVCHPGTVGVRQYDDEPQEAINVSKSRIEQVSLAIIAVFMVPLALQAAFAQKSFFEDFPFGRGWVAGHGDAYNEHLVRDVGVLFLALIIATLWGAWRRQLLRPLAVAWLVQGTLHLVYHVGHLDGFKSADKVGLVGSLVLVPVLALVSLWAGWWPRAGLRSGAPS
jgi:hypothetical protein